LVRVGAALSAPFRAAGRRTSGARPASHIADLQWLIARRAAAIVPGAGLSRLISGDPAATWQGFLRYAVDRCRFLSLQFPQEWFASAEERIASGDADTMAELYAEVKAKLPGGELERLYEDALGHLEIKNPEPARALAAWHCPIITPNFDNLIERITGLESVTWRSPARAQEVLAGIKDGVVHVHGIFNDVGTLVMTPHSYQELLDDQQCQALLHGLKTVKALVFVGCGGTLSDPNFSALFEWSRTNLPNAHLRVYRLVRNDEFARLQLEQHAHDRVALVPYGERYEDLGPFLASLGPKRNLFWQVVCVALAIMLIAFGLKASHDARSPFRVEGTVYLGDRPMPNVAVSIPGYGPPQVTDPQGYFRYDCNRGEPVHDVHVRVGDKPFHFRLAPPITRPSSIELHLEHENDPPNIQPLR
jgi:hypothetical protein